MGLGLVVLDHAARGTINEQLELLDEFPQELPMSDELAEAVHWASTQVPHSKDQGFVEGRVHQGIRRRFGYRPETIGGTLDPSRFPRLYEQGVTPEQFFAMRERVSGLSFIQRIVVTRAVAAGGIVDPPRMSHRGESDFAREVEQAEAERQLAGERVAALRAPSGAAPQNDPNSIGPIGFGPPRTREETEGDASEEEGRSDDDVVAGDWEDLEGERVEEGAHFFEVPLECSRLHRAETSPLDSQPEVCELVAAAVPLALNEDTREELDRCQLRLQAAVKRESNLHVQAVVCDSANGGGRAESLRSAAQQVEHATQDLQHSYDEVLQTHVVPNAVVERDPSEWVGPMREEYEGLQRAVKPLSEATLEQWRREGTPCEVIPAKVICSIKAPKGRRKVRCVCCGNFARSDRWSRADTYSGGIDAVYNDTVVFLTVHGPNVRVAGHRTNPDWGAINVETQLAEGSVPVYGPAAGTDSQPVQGLMHTHSRCDLAYSVSVISAWMTKYPTAAIERGIKVLRYLKAYPEVCLKYGTAPNDKGPEGALKVERSESLVEGYSDASFAPESSRSHGAFLTVWAGATVNWCSKKQAYMTMSTCESELGALSDSGQAVISICPLINEFLWGRAKVQPMALLQEQGHLAPRTQVVLYTDNTASVAVVSLPGGTWRTRHLRIKGAWLQEQAAHETFVRYGDDAMMAFPAQRRGPT
ncbi:Retrovirus-related Pol polyprotein from transposon TNT 1-94 [Symbiodinium microadriaticum]|uniref:Retrovirus-related Pol polyprotein from transposon TNT 1-94 n=1 Tax=Symbiodinium microadriaticum TaxID=2951 RepID=A0A1Q9C2K4_SYMMI|nr:Retrovirus-related Pol polyprotein from transposon TNT 1-94 [Symbiodinium microadriaticum]